MSTFLDTYPNPPSASFTSPAPPEPAEAPAPSRWRQRWALVARLIFAAAGIAISFAIDGGIFGAVLALFAIIVPFEKLYPRKRGQKLRRPMVTTDIGFALMGPLLSAVGITAFAVVGVLSLFWVPGLLFRPLVVQIPAAALPFVAFVVFDFLGYWAHRWAHEVPLLWRFHAVHHSPEHMDWVSGFRVHPFDAILIGPAAIFLLAAGVDGEVTGLLAILQIVLGIFFHANVRVRWRWLDKLVANPEFHHWHHANEADSIGHNYAPALPQWDLLFGTYFMPDRTTGRRPTHYGIDEYIPGNMAGLLSYPLRGWSKHCRFLWHPIQGVKAAMVGTKRLLVDVRHSTTRPTHAVRRASAAGCSSTNDSLFGNAPDRPGVPPVGAQNGVDLFCPHGAPETVAVSAQNGVDLFCDRGAPETVAVSAQKGVHRHGAARSGVVEF